MISTLVLHLACIACILLICFWKRKINYVPLGPDGVPLLGNLLQLGTKPHLKFSHWAKQYGSLYTIHLGHKPTLVVSDANLIRELFGTMESTGRLKSELLLMLPEGSFGIGNAEGQVWVEQKQFFLRAMKNFGFGRTSCMEPRIISEARDLVQWIENEREQNAGKVDLDQILTQSVGNVLWSMITGESIATHESKIVYILDEWFQSLNATARSGVIFFSWIKYLAPVGSGYVAFKTACKKMRQFLDAYFEEHKKSKISGEPPRDMIDAYIDKVENCKDPQSSFYGEAGWKHSFGSVVTIMLAGGESTGTMIRWTIFYLSVYPDVQQKLHEEIDRVIGQNGVPTLEDKARMPYMESVILEILRITAIGPFGVMHELLDNINFHGYQLQTGTLLIANLYHVHHDKTIWGDPETFRPERFLDDNNGESLKNFVIPFQPGKRSCVGERLAKDMMFLFTVKLSQNFAFSMDPSVKGAEEYLESTTGIGMMPKKIPVIVKPRI